MNLNKYNPLKIFNWVRSLLNKVRSISPETVVIKANEFASENKGALAVVVFIIGATFGYYMNEYRYSRIEDRNLNTISALTDTIRVIKTGVNTISSEKKALELSIKDLRALSASKDENIANLKNTIKEIKNRKPNTVLVTNIVTSTQSEIVNDSTVIPLNSDTIVNFKDDILDADVRVIHDSLGVSLPSMSYNISIPLTVSLSKDGTVAVGTKDNIRISSLDSWIDPKLLAKPRRNWFSFGIQSGYGLTLSGLGPYFGVGFGINLISF